MKKETPEEFVERLMTETGLTKVELFEKMEKFEEQLEDLRFLDSIIGLDLHSAEQRLKGKEVRFVKIDGKPMAVTDDFKPERLNLEVENNIVVNCYEG